MQRKAVGLGGRSAVGKHGSRILGLPSTLAKEMDRAARVPQPNVSSTVSSFVPDHITKGLELELEARKARALRVTDNRRLY